VLEGRKSNSLNFQVVSGRLELGSGGLCLSERMKTVFLIFLLVALAGKGLKKVCWIIVGKCAFTYVQHLKEVFFS